MKNRLSLIMLFSLSLTLSACGGGGGSNTPATDVNQQPTTQSMDAMVTQMMLMDENEDPMQMDMENMDYDITEDQEQFAFYFPPQDAN